MVYVPPFGFDAQFALMKTLRILKLIGLCLVNFETFIANCGAKECDATQTKEALGHRHARFTGRSKRAGTMDSM